MAVLETSELPGRASMIDWAFFFGSSAGTLDEYRALVALIAEEDDARAGSDRGKIEGRRRAAPAPAKRIQHVSLNQSQSRFRSIEQAGVGMRAFNWVLSNSPTAVLAKRDAIVMLWETVWCGFVVSGLVGAGVGVKLRYFLAGPFAVGR